MNTGALDCMEEIHCLWTPDLDPLFWGLTRTGVASAWYAHVPFAYWMVGAVKPRMLVEAGTRHGVSYSALCEAVVRHGLETRCFSIASGQGDDLPSEGCGEEIENLRRFHDPRYGAFSELLRCATTGEALSSFADASVDLLHLDGLETYEAARHAFERWLPKLSENAVALIHNTNVRERGFGVWQWWEGVRAQFPSFEFLHGHGLGLLAVGRSAAARVLALCSLTEPARVQAVRQRFSSLGERCSLLAQSARQRDAELAGCQTRVQALENEVALRDARIQALEHEVAAREARLAALEVETAARAAAEKALRARAVERTLQARADLAKGAARAMKTRPFTGWTGTAKTKLRIWYVSGEPDTPGNFYRVLCHAAAAKAAGAEASWVRADELPKRLAQIAQADLLVIWRAPWDSRIAEAVDAARQAGARVVFDVDDLMVDPSLARLDVIDGIRTQSLTEEQVQNHYARIGSTMMAADYCIAPTEELATNLRRFARPALVLPNGFDEEKYQNSRRAVRQRRAEPADGLVRVGYAGGSPTHQRDFAVMAEAVARVLRDRPQCRLVLFRSMVDPSEFPALKGLESQIEWRDLVPLRQLPYELARFDVNVAPLEVGNAYCEAKSELKFFEAALVDVPTVASPTGPYRRAIQDGVTGFLAADPEKWHYALTRLVDDPLLRRRMARAAHHSVLWRYGPLKRADAMLSALPLLCGDGRNATRALAFELHRPPPPKRVDIRIPAADVAFESDHLGEAEVTVVIPLHNYAQYVQEALDSVREQTLETLDLVVVDDASTDESLAVTVEWARRNATRFNRLVILRNQANAGLGPTRNAGIDAAETPFVFLLDADNRLLPSCCAVCLAAIREGNAAFAYPPICKFGDDFGPMDHYQFEPGRLIGGNYIDAMAMVSKEAWAAAGGYGDFRVMGWEDFDFWCRLVEKGLSGCAAGDTPLAEYRVHGRSMLATITVRNAPRVIADLEERHPWLHILPLQPATEPAAEAPPPDALSRIERLLPLLRCPETAEGLSLGTDGALHTASGSRCWPIVEGRPNLFPGMAAPKIQSESHVSNTLPENALALIRDAGDGLVLNLSAGGTLKHFENVVEVEAAIFRHTDIVGDAHNLPFLDGTFDAIIVMNAFEHYRNPRKVAQELYRVLRPGGKILVQTAFLQPLHEKPWHFYNCTRYGLEEWFNDFETLELRVSENFQPGYSISWIASECESALRQNGSSDAADEFKNSPVERIISFWRGGHDARNGDEIWSALARLPQAAQESVAAGFEFYGQRPLG